MTGAAWSMGKYGVYVWPSVSLVLTIIAWNIWSAVRALARARMRALRALAARDLKSNRES